MPIFQISTDMLHWHLNTDKKNTFACKIVKFKPVLGGYSWSGGSESSVACTTFMSGWPSGLRRQTQAQACLNNSVSGIECSGPRMWAWVRIPLLTQPLFIFYTSNIFRQKKHDCLQVGPLCIDSSNRPTPPPIHLTKIICGTMLWSISQSLKRSSSRHPWHNKKTRGSSDAKQFNSTLARKAIKMTVTYIFHTLANVGGRTVSTHQPARSNKTEFSL